MTCFIDISIKATYSTKPILQQIQLYLSNLILLYLNAKYRWLEPENTGEVSLCS